MLLFLAFRSIDRPVDVDVDVDVVVDVDVDVDGLDNEPRPLHGGEGKGFVLGAKGKLEKKERSFFNPIKAPN